MALSKDELVQLASELRAIGVVRFRWGDTELEFDRGGMSSIGAGEGVPLILGDEKPSQTAYDQALVRMASKR